VLRDARKQFVACLHLIGQGLAMPCRMIGTRDRLNFGSMALEGVKEIMERSSLRDISRATCLR
jgi:hypothetical protein